MDNELGKQRAQLTSFDDLFAKMDLMDKEMKTLGRVINEKMLHQEELMSGTINRVKRREKEIEAITNKIDTFKNDSDFCKDSFYSLKEKVYEKCTDIKTELLNDFNWLHVDYKKMKEEQANCQVQIKNHSRVLDDQDTDLERLTRDVKHRFELSIEEL